MEFYATTKIPASADELQKRLTIGELPRYCASIEKVLNDVSSNGEIYSVWGTFIINREEVRGGVRFSLPGCPNVFQWTITTELPPDPQQTVIHATINRNEHDPEFIETLQQFVEHWKVGLKEQW